MSRWPSVVRISLALVAGLATWVTIFDIGGWVMARALRPPADILERVSDPRMWIWSALLIYPVASAVSGFVSGLVAGGRRWLWGALGGGIPVALTTWATLWLVSAIFRQGPNVVAARIGGCALSLLLAAAGGHAAGAIRRPRPAQATHDGEPHPDVRPRQEGR